MDGSVNDMIDVLRAFYSLVVVYVPSMPEISLNIDN